MIHFNPPIALPVAQGLATKVQPAAVFPITSDSEWIVPDDCLFYPDLKWIITEKSDYLRIPLGAYELPADLPYVISAACSWGVQFLDLFQAKFSRKPLHVQLVHGSEVHQLPGLNGEPLFRCFMGIAFCVKSPNSY